MFKPVAAALAAFLLPAVLAGPASAQIAPRPATETALLHLLQKDDAAFAWAGGRRGGFHAGGARAGGFHGARAGAYRGAYRGGVYRGGVARAGVYRGGAYRGAVARRGVYAPYRRYGYGRPVYRGGYYGGYYPYGYGAAGLATGAIIGGALASQPVVTGSVAAPSAAAYCARRFRSYNPATGTYTGYDGLQHRCP